jgi:hypothetical protein
VIYSLAFGDQPALICDLVDWARTCGFPVVAAGRGHKWLPHFSESTPGNGVGQLRPDAGAGAARRPATRRCSTASSTAPSPRSKAPASPTRPASPCPQRPALPAGRAWKTSPSSPGRRAKAACWNARAWWK